MFDNGIAIFFRTLLPDNTLARSVHPAGRDIQIRSNRSHLEDYIVIDVNGNVLGIYPRDYVACILPLDISVLPDAPNKSN